MSANPITETLSRSSTRSSSEIEGTIHPDFQAVADTLRAILKSHGGGAAVCVYHHGDCVVDLWGGVRNGDGEPWRQDTITKGVASALAHIMLDRGLIELDTPVSRYWPEFGQAGKQAISVRQVLAHQSGLYHIRQMIDHADRMLDWEHMISAIERTPPAHEPGTRTGYHGLTYGFLVGELLRRVTGKRFPELVRQELVAPLGLDGMYVGAPSEALARAAELMWPEGGLFAAGRFLGNVGGRVGEGIVQALAGASRFLKLPGIQLDLQSILDALAPRGISSFDFNADETLQASIPAANGLFSARSLARMYAALAGGGEIDGVRILSPEAAERAGQRQRPTAGVLVIPFDLRWRLGYHGVFTTRGAPRDAFGHFGFGGSGAWADPRRNTAVGLIVNSGLGTPFGDLRMVRIGGAVLESIAKRGRDWR